MEVRIEKKLTVISNFKNQYFLRNFRHRQSPVLVEVVNIYIQCPIASLPVFALSVVIPIKTRHCVERERDREIDR